MRKRTGKFYYQNEKETMNKLGLTQTKGSGNGWVEKEDGQNEQILCQLKSTDAMSIKVNLKDIETLNYNAMVSHKLPVFAIQFLSEGDVYLLVKPEDIEGVAKYIETGVVEIKNPNLIGISDDGVELKQTVTKKIGSSKSSREDYYREQNEKYNKENKANAKKY